MWHIGCEKEVLVPPVLVGHIPCFRYGNRNISIASFTQTRQIIIIILNLSWSSTWSVIVELITYVVKPFPESQPLFRYSLRIYRNFAQLSFYF